MTDALSVQRVWSATSPTFRFFLVGMRLVFARIIVDHSVWPSLDPPGTFEGPHWPRRINLAAANFSRASHTEEDAASCRTDFCELLPAFCELCPLRYSRSRRA